VTEYGVSTYWILVFHINYLLKSKLFCLVNSFNYLSVELFIVFKILIIRTTNTVNCKHQTGVKNVM